MPTCVPIREIRDTAAFADRVASSHEPIFVTRNGKDAFVAISGSSYDELARAKAESRLLERMLLAEEERAVGVTTDFFADLEELGAKHGLQG